MEKPICFQTVTPPLDIFSLVKTDPYLVVDTSLYPPEFQAALLTHLSQNLLDGLDTATDGLLIHSDNFQALNLLQARYREQVKCIYIDPPYNTEKDRTDGKFIYKDGYPHSTWITLMDNRIRSSLSFMEKDSMYFLSIDDNELERIKSILYNSPLENIGTIGWESKTKSQNTKDSFNKLQPKIEFILSFSNNKKIKFNLKQIGSKEYPFEDDNGRYREQKIEVMDATGIRGRTSMIFPILGVLPPSRKQWQIGLDTVQGFIDRGDLFIHKDGNPTIKMRPIDERTDITEPFWAFMDKNIGTAENAKSDLKQIIPGHNLDTVKPLNIIKKLSFHSTNSTSLILDYFAGSGTTAHAVINLNREDGGKRKYILVEQAEYFNTVLKPRVQKVIYSKEWKDGKPQADGDGNFHGVPQIVKVLKLESYEDTLNNLQLKKPDLLAHTLSKQTAQDYLLHYMLDIESRDSLLSTDDFRKPFDYRLNIASDSAGAYSPQVIDLVETFNYLLGLRVASMEDRRYEKGYVFIEGYLAGELVLLLWRDCERWDYQSLPQLLRKKQIKPQDSEFAEIYINGDHTLPTVWQDNDADGGSARTLKIRSIEAEFLRLMFAEAE